MSEMSEGSSTGRWRNVGLWAAQLAIFTLFVWVGYLKLTTPISVLATKWWSWTGEVPPSMVWTLGVIELLGGFGIVLPWLTRIKPALTVAAAVGCGLLQCCAIVFHAWRGETSVIWFNCLLLALAICVVIGRRNDLHRTKLAHVSQ